MLKTFVRKVLKKIANKGYLNWLSDKLYIKFLYRISTGEKLNLENPVTFAEKLQWLKLYNRRPEYTLYVDKVKVKDYVSKKIGEEYIIPTIGVWENVDDIDFDTLPDKFVIKCNHNSGTGMYICRDKSKVHINEVKKELRRGMQQDYYKFRREWPYKDVQRRILAEKYVEDKNEQLSSKNEEKASKLGNLIDYKVYCFNGKPKLIQIISDRASDEKIDFYDTKWNRVEGLVGLSSNAQNSLNSIKSPTNLKKMLQFAEILSEGIPFSRIDFYEIQEQLLFGEITFFPASGFGKFRPDKWNYILGEWIKLPKYAK